MTANKMPEAFAVICGVRRNAPKEMWGYLREPGALRGSPDVFTADQMRAMYLAGIEAAKKEVTFGPSTPFDESDYERGCARGWEMYREQVTANLTALEQEFAP